MRKFIPFVLAVALATGCGTSTKTENQGAEPSANSPTTAAASGASTTTTTEAKSAEPGTDRKSPAPVGTTVSPAKGWKVTVTGPANTNATAELKAVNPYNESKKGQFVLVPVKVENNSDEPGMAMTEFSLKALVPSGASLDQDFAVTGEQATLSTQLQPGGTLETKIVFDLSAADAEGMVLIAAPHFTMDQKDDQRFLAIK